MEAEYVAACEAANEAGVQLFYEGVACIIKSWDIIY